MNVARIAKLILERREAELEDLKKKSKKLSELVVEKKFHVCRVLSQSFANKISPISEIQIGGNFSSYDAGYSQCIELRVHSYDNNSIITEKIIFNGYSTAQERDLISVKIPLYEIKETYSDGLPLDHKFFIPRDFKKQEMAIEIINRGRIERSVEYSNFLK